MTDNYPSETSWNVKSAFDKNILLKNGPYNNPRTLYNETYCLVSSGCLEFNILDSFGDGMCCEEYQGNGYYKVFYDNNLIKKGGEFKSYETSVKFGHSCPLDNSSTPPPITSSESSVSSTSTVSMESTGEPLWMDKTATSKKDNPTCGSEGTPKFLVYYGKGPHKKPLKECAGHCNSDSDCSNDLVCFQRDEDVISVPGCYAVPFGKLSYCVSQSQFDPSYSELPPEPSISSTSRDTSGDESIPENPDRYNSDLGLDDDTIFLVLFSTIFTLFISSVLLVYLVYKFFESIWKENEI